MPSFLVVVVLNPVIPKLRESDYTSAFLDAINISAVGLMMAITLRLGLVTLIDFPTLIIPTIIIAIVATILLIKFRINTVWLVLGGALFGAALYLLL
ncbi:MAG: chromate transporter [Promethearchaeota archaeon]